jgi:hypothetical protein
MDSELVNELKGLVTFAIAIIGAGLGILNYIRIADRDRLRLRLSIQGYFTQNYTGMCIEVVNLSAFAVTVSQVGFDVKGGKNIFIMLPTTSLGGGTTPKRLEPRESFTMHFPPGQHECVEFSQVTRAFAKTSCGGRFTATSPYLKSCILSAKQLINKSE